MKLRRKEPADALTRASQLARALAPDPWDLDVFVRNVGDHLGRPIRVVASSELTDDFNGVLAQDADARATIYYRQGVSPRQRDAIVLHEVGHLLLDHPWSMEADVRAMVGHTVSDALIERFLGRSVYDDIHEMEAETFATLVSAHAHTAPLRYADQLTHRLR